MTDLNTMGLGHSGFQLLFLKVDTKINNEHVLKRAFEGIKFVQDTISFHPLAMEPLFISCISGQNYVI